MTNVTYDDGVVVFLALGFIWLVASFEWMVLVGMAWGIGGISKSNAIKIENNANHDE